MTGGTWPLIYYVVALTRTCTAWEIGKIEFGMGYLTTSARAALRPAMRAPLKSAPSVSIAPDFICVSACWARMVVIGERFLHPRPPPHPDNDCRNGSAGNSPRRQPDRRSSSPRTAALHAVR